jgi:hypothetical protein
MCVTSRVTYRNYCSELLFFHFAHNPSDIMSLIVEISKRIPSAVVVAKEKMLIEPNQIFSM